MKAGIKALLAQTGYRRIVVPALLTVAYAHGLAAWLPPGVNQEFAGTLVLVATLVAVLGMLLCLVGPTALRRPARSSPSRMRAGDALLLLLPLAPVAKYVVLNHDVLGWLDVAVLVVGFAVACAVPLLFIPVLLSRWGSRSACLAVGMGLSFSVTNMAAVTRALHWHASGQPLVQLVVLGVVLAVAYVSHRRNPAVLYALCAAMLLSMVLQAAVAGDGEQERAGARPEIPIYRSAPAHRPSIFLLAYDGYVENETMLHYGIDNSTQEQWLEQQGFTIYRGVYSTAASSVSTMGLVLGGARDIQFAVAGESPFFEQLAAAGYTTHGIFVSGYFFQGVGSRYDHGYPPPSSTAYILAMAILEGAFRHNANFAAPPHAEFVARKREVMRAPAEQPLFLYTHTGPGHSPTAGACRANETQLFRQRLEEANAEMRSDVEIVLSAHPNALIVVHGDHGPYLTKTCHDLREPEVPAATITRLDIQDRYGAFLAIRWPEGPTPTVPIRILQDLMPAILSTLYPGEAFDAYRVEPELLRTRRRISGVTVVDGVIRGGADDGRALYESRERDE